MSPEQRDLLRTLRYRLGSARLSELAEAMNRPQGVVLEDLCELEGGALLSPCSGRSPTGAGQ